MENCPSDQLALFTFPFPLEQILCHRNFDDFLLCQKFLRSYFSAIAILTSSPPRHSVAISVNVLLSEIRNGNASNHASDGSDAVSTRPLTTLACARAGPRRWSRAVLALALGSAAEKQGLLVAVQGPPAAEPAAHAWSERRTHLARLPAAEQRRPRSPSPG